MQKTAYELRISDWSSDVCSSDLTLPLLRAQLTDSAGAVLAEWSFEPPRSELDAGDSAPFETETRNPPEGAENLNITFVGSDTPAAQSAAGRTIGGPSPQAPLSLA